MLAETIIPERARGDHRRGLDISQRARSEQFLRPQHAVTVALAEADSVRDVLPDVLGALGKAMQWRLAAYWQPKGKELRCALTWQSEERTDSALLETSRRRLLSPGEGLPGQAWALGEPVWMSEVTKDLQFTRSEEALRDGLHAGVALPVPSEEGMRGVFEFFSSEAMLRQHELVEMMSSLSGPGGPFPRCPRAAGGAGEPARAPGHDRRAHRGLQPPWLG